VDTGYLFGNSLQRHGSLSMISTAGALCENGRDVKTNEIHTAPHKIDREMGDQYSGDCLA